MESMVIFISIKFDFDKHYNLGDHHSIYPFCVL